MSDVHDATLTRDGGLPLGAITAGFITVLVGYTSSAAIVFQAATAAGATAAQLASWMIALGLGMGVTCIGLSLRYRVPVVTAWSTPGAALLVTSLPGLSMAEAIGAFLFSALLITVSGATGAFERAINRIPLPIAAAMLAGVLLRFGLDVFVAMQTEVILVGAMFVAYLIARRQVPRYAIMLVLGLGLALAYGLGLMNTGALTLTVAAPVFTMPAFSWQALIGVGVPLFVVTMASQNIPGVAVMRAAGFQAPISPIITWTGITTLLLAPFGGYAFNLAAITAAICMSDSAHPNPDKRYLASVAAGVFYLVLGVFGATVGALFLAFPQALVLAIAGLALLGTIGNSLATALGDETVREPALITFLVTASGLSLLGIGSAFWGLLAGALALLATRRRPA